MYHRPIQIEFNHCDPAGIVFFPRFYEMVSSVCENFYKDVAGYPYARMMAAQQGVPTVRMEPTFTPLPASATSLISGWRLNALAARQSPF